MSLILAGAALAQSIVVQGNERVDAETVRSYFSGERLDQAGIDRAVRAMYNSGQFSDVRVSRSGNSIIVRVTENAIVNRVTISGNSRVKADQLFPELQTKSRGPFSQAVVDSDVQRILEIYRRIGRGDATVSATTDTAPNGRIDVTFNIVEGSKTGIYSINFEGNNAFGSWRLKNLMQMTESNLLSFLKTSDVYDPDRLAADLDLIRRHYLKNGFIDFRVVSSEAVYSPERKGYIITIVLDEGEQYRVGNVEVSSRLPNIDERQLRSRVLTTPGSVYNAEAVEKTVEAMTMDAARRGQPFVQVRPRGDREAASKTVNLGYTADEGARIYVERINVRGNTRTRDEVVRREFELGEGDAYNKALVDRAERRLKSLGFFKSVKISQEPGSAPDRVVLVVDVEDQPTGQFSVGVGYSTTDGIIGEASIAEQNLLGRGQFLRFGFTYGQRTRSAELSFTEPYFLGYRMSGGFDVFTRYTDNSNISRYISRATGGTLRLGVPITEDFGIGIRYSLYNTQLTVPNTTRDPYNDCNVPIFGITPTETSSPQKSAVFNCLTNGEASLAVKEAAGNTVTSSAGLNFVYTTLDDRKNPTSGWLAELKPEVAGLGGDSRFFRISGEVRYYYPIWDDVVGMLKASGGYVQALGGNTLRLSDNFNPGPSLVRGFAPGGFGPRDISYDANTGSLGGTTYFGGTAEVQFPFFGLPKEIGLRGALFADAGTLFDYQGYKFFNTLNGRTYGTLTTPIPTAVNPGGGCVATNTAPLYTQGNCLDVYDSRAIRASIGASLLWQSPLGPLRFDYAFPIARSLYDRTQYFRFSGGGSF
ncbi:MAG: outer membrane protein assembly factor BamA [Methylocystis sp.]|nr:outer membrane protein assembly factor BamA [Methylocystis sp.]MCA3584084.1 outer membrane protein assembly factor BamA [Methylocystis sp.]MCA3588956.1 outer membrane protein assembly factor BamA [Methylocystis sp.]MCA3591204.1 outer membrane protein assembly factor BamA [Methylocystis sp.]